VIEPDFREMAFGAWEGLHRDEVAARHPTEAAAWAGTPHVVTPPGGEALTAVDARVRAALAALIERHRGETVILVSHAIVTRLIVLAALGLGPDRLWSVDASPAGITEIEYLDAWATVHCMNTLAHLDGLRRTAREAGARAAAEGRADPTTWTGRIRGGHDQLACHQNFCHRRLSGRGGGQRSGVTVRRTVATRRMRPRSP